ncbi:uncharacterized protein STEHIDRAFT_117838 [Stereum hirsutum FP-91666 SS1]|uniref:uncharacterized protein n=1 Tax=Stereum hirsutum (strain FP-91666) TaxID=721885 RepID=UPI0004409ED6|nr:uncharacterized protein STEHIDRAFT_117838 [Stereum hirsutum FP-91666 SS1]EIM92909.1 hypothetical protein STEHIDRAFT_117838 [Stereum hirsutum FP-91666 SS1]
MFILVFRHDSTVRRKTSMHRCFCICTSLQKSSRRTRIQSISLRADARYVALSWSSPFVLQKLVQQEPTPGCSRDRAVIAPTVVVFAMFISASSWI